ncbi:ras-related protein Rab-34 [Hermetia illucens]|uniref:ras-related protein Rab-34 n=1 Tax=Hermetia illucens TaxID=343691 RepID=UPI0018CC03D5|nr:ras-related protein Rab-34 [Hermetia illucens]
MHNRVIDSFPPPYHKEVTPYSQDNFSDEVLKGYHRKVVSNFQNVCKVIVVGDVSVGKTALVNRFSYNTFDDESRATIGVDFEIANFSVMGVNFNLQVWDTAGQERFKCIAHAYYRNANVILIVFDLNNLETLRNVPEWLASTLKVNSRTPLIFLVGTKCDALDLEELALVEQIAMDLATNVNAEYWSVSAKTGFSVVELFHRMVALAFDDAIKQCLVECMSRKSLTSSSLKLTKVTTEEDSASKCTMCYPC